MPVKKLQLTLAECQVIGLLVSEPRDGKVEAARMVRHVRGKLELRRTSRTLDRISKQLKELELPELNWDDLLDPSNLNERIGELLSESQTDDGRTELGSLLDNVQFVGHAGEFTLDDTHLTWLRDLIVDKDWKKPQKVRQDGQSESVVPVVPSALLEAFANVADKVTDALASKEEM